jgi:flagellar M-ring protein FliF
MITVVDQRGKLLTNNEDGGMAFSGKQLEYKQNIEASYVKRIVNILTPIVGSGKVKAQVNTDLDFTVVEKTQESFNPDQLALRSEQIVNEESQGNNPVNGVPGALTNQPPAEAQLGAAPATNQPAVTTETVTASGNSRRRAVRNFEVDKTISHTRLATGTVRRLSVAVLVDDKVTDVGKAAYTDVELERFATLIRDAVGFNPQRGDSVNVVNAAFTVEAEPEPLPEEPIWKQAWVWNIAKQVLAGLVVLLLILGVLKPVMRELASKGVEFKKRRSQADTTEEELSFAGHEVTHKLTAPVYESHVQAAGSMVDQNPRTVAQVLKNWVATDGD